MNTRNPKLLKRLFQHDLYTRKHVNIRHRTIEHIVPTNLLLTKQQKKDMTNLFMVDTTIQQFRQGYRFGGSIDEILETSDQWETLGHVVYRHPEQRLFFPLYGRPIIAHTCVEMMDRYPELQKMGDQIMIYDDVLQWTGTPLDSFDKDLLKLRYLHKFT